MQLLLLWQQGGHSTTAQLEISQDIKGNFSKKKKKGCEFLGGPLKLSLNIDL